MFLLDPYYFAITAIVTFVYQMSFYALAATCKFDTVTDLAGGSNFVILTILTLVLSGSYTTREIIASVFVAVWGARIAGYLFIRILKTKTDSRFDERREDPLKFLVFWIFQILWVWIVSLPITMLHALTTVEVPFGLPTDIAGVVLFGVGFLLEATADQQKFSFKNKPENKKRFCNVGVWRYSRHPNYLGDITLWIGLCVLGAGFVIPITPVGWITLLSPLFVITILLFVSGAPMLEDSSDERYGSDPEYRRWKESTSPLFLMPPSIYSRLPRWVKTVFFLELPLYSRKYPRDEALASA